MNSKVGVRSYRVARRTFLFRSAATAGGLLTGSLGQVRAARGGEVHPWLRAHQQHTPLAGRPTISDVKHVTLHRSPTTYCSHPRQCLFQYFGGGETIVGHNHAPCRYQASSDVAHDLGGYHSRAKALLQRSLDGGRSWSEPAPIVGKGGGCWKELGERDGGSWVYRSPWPMRLKDGRILVVYARRRPPFGIGGTLSADGGKTFSHEFVIRAGEASNDDLGYPVGCQLDDGRIFLAYYYNEPGKGYLDAVRYIAGSFFRIA